MNHLNFVRLSECSLKAKGSPKSSLHPSRNSYSLETYTLSQAFFADFSGNNIQPCSTHSQLRFCRKCGVRHFTSRDEKETANQRLLKKLFRNTPRSEFLASQQKLSTTQRRETEPNDNEDDGESIESLELDEKDLTTTEILHPDLKLYNQLYGIEDDERLAINARAELAQKGDSVTEEEFLQKLDPHGYTRQVLDVLPLLFPDEQILQEVSSMGLSSEDMYKQRLQDKEEAQEFEDRFEQSEIPEDEDEEGEQTLSSEQDETPTDFRKRWESRLNLPPGSTEPPKQKKSDEEGEEDLEKLLTEADSEDSADPLETEEERDEFVFPHNYPGGEAVEEFLAERHIHTEKIDPQLKRRPSRKASSQFDLPKPNWGLVNAQDSLENWLGRDESDLWRYAYASEKEVEEQLWADLNIPKSKSWRYSTIDEEIDDYFRAKVMAQWDKEGHPSIPSYIPDWVKEEIYHLHNEDPVEFDIDSLALAYQIPTGVIAGILLGKGRERKLQALGHKPVTAVETWLKIYLRSRHDTRTLYPQSREYEKVEQARLAPLTMDFQDPEVGNPDYYLGFDKNKKKEQDPLTTRSKKVKKTKTRVRDFPKHVPVLDSLGDDLSFIQLPDKAEPEFRTKGKTFFIDLNKKHTDSDVPIYVWNYGRIRVANEMERVYCLQNHGKKRTKYQGVPVPYRADLIPVTQDILNIDANSLAYLYEDVKFARVVRHPESDEPTFDLSIFAEPREIDAPAPRPDILGNPHLQGGKMVPGNSEGVDLFHPDFLDRNREIEWIAPMSIEQQKLAETLRQAGRESAKPKETDQKVQFHELIEHYKQILNTKQQDTQVGRTPVNPFSIRSSTREESGAPQFDFKALIDSIGSKSG